MWFSCHSGNSQCQFSRSYPSGHAPSALSHALSLSTQRKVSCWLFASYCCCCFLCFFSFFYAASHWRLVFHLYQVSPFVFSLSLSLAFSLLHIQLRVTVMNALFFLSLLRLALIPPELAVQCDSLTSSSLSARSASPFSLILSPLSLSLSCLSCHFHLPLVPGMFHYAAASSWATARNTRHFMHFTGMLLLRVPYGMWGVCDLSKSLAMGKVLKKYFFIGFSMKLKV